MARRKPGHGSIPGKWEFPGGKVRTGEKPEQTLKREFLEEFGIGIEVGDFIMSAPFSNGDKNYLMKVYSVRFLSGEIRLREHDAYDWISFENLRTMDCAYSDSLIVDYLLSSGLR